MNLTYAHIIGYSARDPRTLDRVEAVLRTLGISGRLAMSAASVIQSCLMDGRDPTDRELDELERHQRAVHLKG